jgi:hypothetical protein
VTDLAALHEALDAAARASLAAEAGDRGPASMLLLTASRAADRAYEDGTPEAESFALILADIGVAATGEAA